jgi:Arc/MetJ-type ribon-helix-helix transcriptional regulator
VELKNMPKISVKLPEKMYQQLLLTTQEFELENISAAIRLLLQAALEKQNLPTPKAQHSQINCKRRPHTTALWPII